MNFVIDAARKVKASPILYGLFFEDINHSLDGGLNANLLQNGNFEFSYFSYGAPKVQRVFDHLRFWSCEPQKFMSVTNEKPIHSNNPHSLKIEAEKDIAVVLKNLGYEIKGNNNFIFLNDSNFSCSFFYSSNHKFDLQCFFEYENGKTSPPIKLTLSASEKYKQIEFSLSGKKSSFARLVFRVSGQGEIYFTNFRLLPSNYFKSSKNSYRYGKFNATLVESLKMGAKFLRFPGGCLVEGDVSPEFLYEWEKTIGPLESRISKPSVWNYLQSNEIGFFEYFCLCEDLDLLPVPVHHVGLNCQIRTQVFRNEGYLALSPKSKEFACKVVDSIAHLIYFAKGDTNSADENERLWAKKRKEMGHAKPFRLEHIAIGNENWDEIYFRNFNAAIKGLQNYCYCGQKTDLLSKFGIQILSSAGVDINPQDTNPSWKYIKQNYKNLIIDEHVYNTPEWFVDNFYRYDFYDPNECKVFMGEYACHTQADGKGLLGGKNTFISALCESVFMCGMENNPSVVKMSCYAPLFVKKNQANWNPDLIEFDNNKVFLTPNYHAQALFMQNYGKHAIKPQFDKDKSLRGKFLIDKMANRVASAMLKTCDGKKIDAQIDQNGECKKEIENFVAEINFENKPTDFSAYFENKKERFKFCLHFNQDGLFYEKLVNAKRMTLEKLWGGKLDKKVSISIDNQQIQVKSNGKVVASKVLWKTTENVFCSCTFDSKKVYVKLVNVSRQQQQVNIDFKKLFSKGKISGKIVTLLQNEKDGCSCIKKSKSVGGNANDFAVKLQPLTINLLVLER